MFQPMDAHLKVLADAGLAVTEAEEAIGETAYGTAREALDRAGEHLAALRAAWPSMTGPERDIVGRTAAPLRARLEAAAARIPKRTALTEVAPEHDPEEDLEPAA